MDNSLFQNEALLIRLHLGELFLLFPFHVLPQSFQAINLLRHLQTQADWVCFPVSRPICQTKQAKQDFDLWAFWSELVVLVPTLSVWAVTPWAPHCGQLRSWDGGLLGLPRMYCPHLEMVSLACPLLSGALWHEQWAGRTHSAHPKCLLPAISFSRNKGQCGLHYFQFYANFIKNSQSSCFTIESGISAGQELKSDLLSKSSEPKDK